MVHEPYSVLYDVNVDVGVEPLVLHLEEGLLVVVLPHVLEGEMFGPTGHGEPLLIDGLLAELVHVGELQHLHGEVLGQVRVADGAPAAV